MKNNISSRNNTRISLFSFQLGSSLVYADETVETPKSEIVETLPGEGLPDVETELNGGTTENQQNLNNCSQRNLKKSQ